MPYIIFLVIAKFQQHDAQLKSKKTYFRGEIEIKPTKIPNYLRILFLSNLVRKLLSQWALKIN